MLTRVVGSAIDVSVVALANFLSFMLRFDFSMPRYGWLAIAASCITVCLVYIVSMIGFGCYRRAWRRFTLSDLMLYLVSCAVACGVLLVLRIVTPYIFSHIRPPYSISLMTFALSFIGLTQWRIVWSWLGASKQGTEVLLERDVRKMDSSIALNFIRGKTVMVTGAGGSIGSEIVRQVAAAEPKMLLLVERCENALYEIDRELKGLAPLLTAPLHMKPLMVDINDLERMEDIFNFYRPEIVLHAAAYKHVPMVEMNPREGERNNTIGTRNLAELAKRFKVSRFVLISTDKAVNPVSVMGKTKRAAEKAIMEIGKTGETSFCAVRFGNVLGSSGSVVPLFREQIRKRQPITVTHPDMKRYFMTIKEAVGLVLQAASRTERAIYTLDMGEPVRIVTLAEDMIRQAGYKPYVDIPIIFTGIRPGEKLFEELDISERSAYKTDMARIYITRIADD